VSVKTKKKKKQKKKDKRERKSLSVSLGYVGYLQAEEKKRGKIRKKEGKEKGKN